MAHNGKASCRNCGAAAAYSVHEPAVGIAQGWVWNTYCDRHVPPEGAAAPASRA